jgi:mono/diheme cytochrome c family protein
MRELEGPWTHFFAPVVGGQTPFPFDEPTGGDLAADYLQAKDDEPYAGVPARALGVTIGFSLQRVVNRDQPVIFEGSDILNERWPWSPEGYAAEPRRSSTWDEGYAAFKRGEQLALPYFAPRVTDADKLARLTSAYRAYRAGEQNAADLPDFSDVFSDDPQTRAEIGLQTEPDAPPAQLLIQACATCHNDVLDQSLSRARFNVALDRLDRAELDVAIARLKAPRGAVGAMPPKDARQLDEAGLVRLIDYLAADARDAADADALEQAAQRGMARPAALRR